jgi:hypothetical protein
MRLVSIVVGVALLLSDAPASTAVTQQCTIKVCVEVYTDPSTGRVIITAKKNPARRAVKHRTTPRVINPTPKPRPKRVYKPRSPIVKKPGPSLADRLTQLIPIKPIHVQPQGSALVQVPVNFWTETESRFLKSVIILGVPVSVNLTPTFEWNFGDGSLPFETDVRGGPYPFMGITHTYRKAGEYQASLHISWSGTWSSEGNTFPVLGNNIVQTMSATIRVVEAPTKFTR